MYKPRTVNIYKFFLVLFAILMTIASCDLPIDDLNCPPITISSSFNDTIQVGGTATFNSSSSNSSDYESFRWELLLNTELIDEGTGDTYVAVIDSMGDYTVVLTGTCNDGSSSQDSLMFVAYKQTEGYDCNSLEITTIITDTVFVGTTLTFELSASDISDYNWFHWDILLDSALVGSSDQISFDYTITEEGNYEVLLSAECKDGSRIDDALSFWAYRKNVIIKADFTLDPEDSIDIGTQLTIVNTSIGGSSYVMNFGDPSGNNNIIETDQLEPFHHTFSNSGIYTIKLDAKDSDGNVVSSKEDTIKVTKMVNVTFRVNMAEVPYNTTDIYFYAKARSRIPLDWNFAKTMDRISGTDVWTATQSLRNYSKYIYAFSYDNASNNFEKLIPSNCSEQIPGHTNRVRTLSLDSNDDVVLDVICFNECSDCIWTCGELLYDHRDHKKYKTLWFDENGGNNTDVPGHCWMVENVDFNNGSVTYYQDNNRDQSRGKMYRNVNLEFICPSDWHIPSLPEWNALLTSRGFTYTPTGNSGTFEGDYQYLDDFNLARGGAKYRNENWLSLDYSSFWVRFEFDVLLDFRKDEVLYNSRGRSQSEASYCRCVHD